MGSCRRPHDETIPHKALSVLIVTISIWMEMYHRRCWRMCRSGIHTDWNLLRICYSGEWSQVQNKLEVGHSKKRPFTRAFNYWAQIKIQLVFHSAGCNYNNVELVAYESGCKERFGCGSFVCRVKSLCMLIYTFFFTTCRSLFTTSPISVFEGFLTVQFKTWNNVVLGHTNRN